MSRDKQIEEMAKAIKFCKDTSINECHTKDSCRHCIAEQIYNAGYRKQSEVAMEILENIEKLITKECLVFKDENGIRGYVDASVHYAIAELKKKYTEQCPDCKHFIGCEKAVWVGICGRYEEVEEARRDK